MPSRKVRDQAEDSRMVSSKVRLKEVQQVLDEMRSLIRQYGFTPEQVFGYHGKAEFANLIADGNSSSVSPIVAKKQAMRQRIAAGKAAPAKPAVRPASLNKPEAPKKLKSGTAPSPSSTVLNPTAAWPFPSGRS